MKYTLRENVNTPYSLHDMNVEALEINGDDLIMRTQAS